jgi:hypothetical protein
LLVQAGEGCPCLLVYHLLGQDTGSLAEQRPVPEVPGDAQRPSSPEHSDGQPLIGQQVSQRDPERHPRLGQQAHRLWFGVAGRDAGFQPGDQRPQRRDHPPGPGGTGNSIGEK